MRLVSIFLSALLLAVSALAFGEDAKLPDCTTEHETGGAAMMMPVGETFLAALYPFPPKRILTPPPSPWDQIRTSSWRQRRQEVMYWDFNRDGQLDLIRAQRDAAHPTEVPHGIHLQKDGVFAELPDNTVVTPAGSWTDSNYIDVNADGCPDQILFDHTPYGLFNLRALTKVWVKYCLPEKGKYTDTPVLLVRQKGFFIPEWSLFDLNDDGRPDILFLDVEPRAITPATLAATLLGGEVRTTLRVHLNTGSKHPFSQKATTEYTFRAGFLPPPTIAPCCPEECGRRLVKIISPGKEPLNLHFDAKSGKLKPTPE